MLLFFEVSGLGITFHYQAVVEVIVADGNARCVPYFDDRRELKFNWLCDDLRTKHLVSIVSDLN